jgi:predicted DNA-binding WGR domain protein
MHTSYFERQDSKASQFWAITLDDRCFEIHQGKVGTPGKSQRKDCDDRSICEKKAAQHIQAQAAKGFSELDLTQPNDLGDFSTPSLQSILSLPSLPPAFFERSANTSIYEVQKAIANHPQATQIALENLAQSSYPDVVELAQLHVNLASEITEGWQENVIARLKALDLNPKRKSVLELAALGIIPDFLLDSLALDLRVAIAKQPETAPQTLALLAEDYHENVRKVIAANLNTPTDVLEKLVGDRTVEVRVALAKNPTTPASALIQLADDVYEKVRKIVLKHPRIPGEALYKLRNLISNNVEYYLRQAASDSDLSPDTLSKMAQEYNWRVRKLVARNPRMPLEFLEKLANDPYDSVCQSVAANPSTPFNILKKLANYGISWAGRGIGSDPNVPTNALVEKHPVSKEQVAMVSQKLPDSRDIAERSKPAITANPNTSKSLTLNVYAQSNCAFSRLSVLMCCQISSPILERLASSELWWERYAIAQNPNAPVELIQALHQDHNCLVLAAARVHLPD